MEVEQVVVRGLINHGHPSKGWELMELEWDVGKTQALGSHRME